MLSHLFAVERCFIKDAWLCVCIWLFCSYSWVIVFLQSGFCMFNQSDIEFSAKYSCDAYLHSFHSIDYCLHLWGENLILNTNFPTIPHWAICSFSAAIAIVTLCKLPRDFSRLNLKKKKGHKYQFQT